MGYWNKDETDLQPSMTRHAQNLSEVYKKLNLALGMCGCPAVCDTNDVQYLASGAWHDVYRVRLPDHDPLVFRLRKKIIYGKSEPFNAQTLHEDYAPVALYYQEANLCQAGICPQIYQYRIDPDLTFTLESHVDGVPIPIKELSIETAIEIGESLGDFFRLMHRRPAPLSGSGLVSWDGDQPIAASEKERLPLWQHRQENAERQLNTLVRSGFKFDQANVKFKLSEVLQSRNHAGEPIALVNRDITPENLLVRDKQWIGLVDPVPMLDNGSFYAAWFTHCYRFLLPALDHAPRYKHHRFRDHQKVLGAIASGFEAGYTQNDRVRRHMLLQDEFLWMLDGACQNYWLIEKGMSREMQMRMGNSASVKRMIIHQLQTLEKTDW